MIQQRSVLSILCLLIVLGFSSISLAGKKHPAEEKGLKSSDSDFETKITFENKSKKTIKIFWLDQDGERKHYATLEDGETHEQDTYLTHPWLITDEDEDAWYVYFPDSEPRKIEIVAPKN